MIVKLGLRGQTAAEIAKERDRQVRLQCADAIENFPDKIDQFLGKLSRVNLMKHLLLIFIDCFIFYFCRSASIRKPN